MKLIKKHQFGGLIGSLSNILKPKYSIDERPTGPTPPASGWTKMEPFESGISVKPKIQLSKPSISNTILTDALNVNNNIVTPILKSIFTPYNKFLYDAIFTDADGKPYEYKEVNNTFNKRFLSPLEASDFLDKKRNQWKQNDFRYALRSQVSKHLPGGRVLPTAPPAEQRYAGGKRVINSGKEFGDSVSIRGVEAQSPWYKHPALIVERIRHSKVSPEFNDTTYAERPEFLGFVTTRVRSAGNDYLFGKKIRYNLPIVGGFVNANYDKSTPQEQQEYDTLKKRFNTAWGAAKHQEGGNIERTDNTRVLKPTQFPLKVKPINWNGAIQGSYNTMEPNSHGGETFYSVQRKQSKLGDKFTKEIRTYYSPGENYVSDTTYSINPVYGESRLAFRGRYDDSAYPSLNLYDSLKTAFNRVVAKETNQHPYFLK